jgi:hypothetical protein
MTGRREFDIAKVVGLLEDAISAIPSEMDELRGSLARISQPFCTTHFRIAGPYRISEATRSGWDTEASILGVEAASTKLADPSPSARAVNTIR